MATFDPDLWYRVVDVAAVAANGLLGGAVARAFRFDVVGFLMLAVASGMGGGLIRDVLLNTGLPVALTDSAYWVAALVSAGVAYAIDLGGKITDRLLLIVDFVGMGCWAATGTLKSLSVGLHWFPAVVLGVVTAVGGGIIRDVMVNRIPSIFGGNSLYATIAFIGAAEMAIFTVALNQPTLGMAVAILSCGVLGLLSRWRNWQLPQPVSITVPRPSFRSKTRRRTKRLLVRETWRPGDPLTENLEIITPERLDNYRRNER
ncbi:MULTISPECIES: trimeric intracellular cation channel family protein [unclassified Rothia (in: high G+C Gram-positive bacteria)]|uniref:trimeric intracellular cation channel family protein n=1 Tax=unclassified Rothia (in: high G+C Gram-positive bacteria) TaxID=2689056 RepID=UPI00195A8818|nr:MULTISPECIES: TRIC cation channel family protein [unclassified Rothia (in: high G+C Gram-positive bacteria)]MBM7051829.1 TRIC cation channel family protein [Rothia sp. ZJ1223]QRZ61555.1 TRIC cation channel family protein [Rothia sp. ZJ932]